MSQTTVSETVITRPRRRGLTAVLLRHVLAAMTRGSITVTLPDGTRMRHRAALPGPDAELVVHRGRALRRLLLGGDVAFAEAYMDGDWSSPDLTALVELAASNGSRLERMTQGSLPMRWLNRMLHLARANTRSGSRRNIEAHYDLGNDFYARWLDAGMSYSSALYADPAMTLEEAQAAKQDRIVDLLSPAAGDTVLEIGIGWGGMAARLAKTGCAVTGLTISPAQLAYARARLEGLPVEMQLRDYRDVTGQFDGIVSVEMLEAVGEAYWPVYFAKLKQCLAPGGRAVLQVITICDDRFDHYRTAPDFIQVHVFPGGMLPSPGQVAAHAARAGLAITGHQSFGMDYARTLVEWRTRFERASADIAAMGFSARFRRMWEYYLCYCEAGFRTGVLDVGLWRLEHAA